MENNQTVTNQENPIIRCDNLVKIYKTPDLEVMALQGLDLEIARGELVAIIGNSGSGKSTFLNMLGGLDKPSAGALFVDNENLFQMTEAQLAYYKQFTVGFVWQNSARNLLPYLTALENVEITMQSKKAKEKKERAFYLLELVGMKEKWNSKLKQLSGGEQQRIAIAIALANNPKILLADEPTGAVDIKTSDAILKVFQQLNEKLGITVVIVTHDNNLAKKVNRVIQIRDGKISTERINRQSYLEQMEHIDLNMKTNENENNYDEYIILDKSGRVQIPKEVLEKIGVTDNKLKLEIQDGKILLSHS